MAKKNLDYYLNLPYTYIIEWSDADNCFLGSIVEYAGVTGIKIKVSADLRG